MPRGLTACVACSLPKKQHDRGALRAGLAQHLEARIGKRAGKPEPRSGFHDAAERGDKWTAVDRCETVACAEGQGGEIEG